MFTLMRNLRRNLINNNLVGKYFLYAFGEFILIVLGILVALWIDNWNQERQELKREQFYLSGLKEEFQVSLQQTSKQFTMPPVKGILNRSWS